MNRESDPWMRWYDAYLAQRAEMNVARRLALERRRAANVLAGALLGYMLVGGLAASVAIGLVMSN